MKNNYLVIECRSFTPLVSAVDEILKGTNLKFITYKRYGSAYNTAVFAGQHSSCINGEELAVNTINHICNQIPSNNIIKAGVSRLIAASVITSPEEDIINLFFNTSNRIGVSKKTSFESKNYDSLAFIDSRGLTALITAADELLENYPVEIVDCRKMGSGRLTLIFAGKIDVLEAALKEAKDIVREYGKYIGSSLLSNIDNNFLKSL
ncbi:BMC domain-containing protein [Halanaerobium congolense]|jgi:microcompartment protein CcmL/EutN|uniref:Microcompartment protein CcmL/EutN n=1 Tax=Halanaerobium congolense TaxID=54121 RepID=A0A1G6KHF1_9FIRM|nr:BMC domain-containing protein [Halanaerobium congolense]PXV62569.1 microcompartment protein CcmL/EutN [Halanaerobium congolense]SDC29995.1 Carboxysome shell and ethanolamine utilization microcompartment protein CcmL/EutN [Halanaerobium congolense]